MLPNLFKIYGIQGECENRTHHSRQFQKSNSYLERGDHVFTRLLKIVFSIKPRRKERMQIPRPWSIISIISIQSFETPKEEKRTAISITSKFAFFIAPQEWKIRIRMPHAWLAQSNNTKLYQFISSPSIIWESITPAGHQNSSWKDASEGS